MLLILSFLGIFGLFPFFLSDPSPIIGNACHSLTDSLPNWLTDSLLFSGLDGCQWYQLLDGVATATENREKLREKLS